MGRAIVRDPQVFLFDEPLSNLDAKLRVQMRAEIKELHQRLNTTTVYVTHDQIEAMTMADKIVVMNGGRRRADRRAARALRPAGQSVRGGLHRLAGDEFPEGPGRGRRVPHRRRRGLPLPAGPAAGRPAGGLRRAPRAFPAGSRRHAGEGAGGRADRLGDPGDGGVAGARSSVPSASGCRPGRARRSASRPTRRWCICSTRHRPATDG